MTSFFGDLYVLRNCSANGKAARDAVPRDASGASPRERRADKTGGQCSIWEKTANKQDAYLSSKVHNVNLDSLIWDQGQPDERSNGYGRGNRRH